MKTEPAILASVANDFESSSHGRELDYFIDMYGFDEATSTLLMTYMRTYFGCVMGVTAAYCALYGQNVTKEKMNICSSNILEQFYPARGTMFFHLKLR